MSMVLRPAFAVTLLTLLGAILRFYDLGGEPLWYDEAVSYSRATMPLLEAIQQTANTDAHPPLYYLILHFMLAFGNSEFTVRLFSALCGILLIPLTYAIGKNYGDHKIGLIAALLVTISPLQVFYSQEARAYSFYALSAALAIWGLTRLLNKPIVASVQSSGQNAPDSYLSRLPAAWIAYVLGTTLALYSNNLGVFLLLATNLFALFWLWWERAHFATLLRYWIIANLIIVVLWGIWWPGLLMQTQKAVEGTYWFSADFQALMDLVNDLWISLFWKFRPALLILLVVAVIFGLYNLRRNVKLLIFSLIMFVVPILGTYLISQWKPIMVTRALIWTSIPLLLIMASAIVGLRSKWLMPAALIFIAMMNFRGLNVYYAEHAKERWNEVAAHIADHVQPGDTIVITPAYMTKAFDYYWKRTGKTVPVFSVDSFRPGSKYGESAAVENKMGRFQRTWVIAPRLKKDDVVNMKTNLSDQISLLEELQFRGTGFETDCSAMCIRVFLYAKSSEE